MLFSEFILRHTEHVNAMRLGLIIALLNYSKVTGCLL